jgi:hypothetical protein
MEIVESDQDVRDDDVSADADLRRALVLALALGAVGAVSASAQTDRKAFTPEELDQMMAPIALYPDSLLSQVMMAATYPLEVVDAARWSQANANVKGDAAVAAVQDKSWDVSVKSLVAFPPVLKQMSDHLDWTQKLGDAMIGQQQDVADSIQRLRARAVDANTLQSTKEQAVKTETQGTDRVIVIEPTDPQVIYAPSYDPSWAYGGWPYPSSPPYYWPFGGALARGFLWGAGFAAAGAMFGGWGWGYGAGNSYVNINANRATNIDRNFNRNNIGNGNRWQHDREHRKGVSYRDNATREKFGQSRPGADQRQQFRGQLDQRPGGAGGARPGQGAGAGARPGGGAAGGARPGGPAGGARPGGPAAGQRPANRPAQQPSGGGLGGVNRGQQVNRESQRGRAQQNRAGSYSRGGGGGGRPGGGGGGGGRPGGGGGGGRPGGGGGGGRPGGGGGRR